MIRWRPADRNRFHSPNNKAAGVLGVSCAPNGTEVVKTMVTIPGVHTDNFCYIGYSRILAEYLNSIDFEDCCTLDIIDRLEDSLKKFTKFERTNVTFGNEMYDGDSCCCIRIYPESSVLTFAINLEHTVQRTNTTETIVCSVPALLEVLGVGDESEVIGDATLYMDGERHGQ